MTFQQVEQEYKKLKSRYDTGELSEAGLKTALHDLMVQDERGDWWLIGYKSGHWHRHDGEKWVEANPPEDLLPGGGMEGREARRLTLATVILGAVVLVLAGLLGFWGWKLLNPTAAPTPAPTARPTATLAPVLTPGAMLFQDDFSNPDSGWPVISADGDTASPAGGRYAVQPGSKHTLVLPPGRDFTDVSLEVDVTIGETGFIGTVGLVCRYSPQGGYYSLILRDDGYFYILYAGSNTLAVEQAGRGFKAGDTFHLRADCAGQTLYFFLDGRLLASVTDSSLTHGDVGLYASNRDEPNGAVSFDNFTVRDLSTAAPVQEQILFEDDFSDPQSGWLTWKDAYTSAEYTADGQFRIDSVPGGFMSRSYVERNFTDASVEVDIARTDSSNKGIGLICRYQDDNNYYYFWADSQGTAVIGKVLQGVNADIAGEFSDVKIEGAITHLRADCKGSTLTLYANGQWAGTVTDTSFTGGYAGLYVMSGDSNMEITFDNFTVRGLGAAQN